MPEIYLVAHCNRDIFLNRVAEKTEKKNAKMLFAGKGVGYSRKGWIPGSHPGMTNWP